MGFIFFKRRKPKRKNLNLVLKVLNKFGSLVPLVLLFTWACCYWFLLFFFSFGATILLFLQLDFFFLSFISLLPLFLSFYCYYFYFYYNCFFPIITFLSLLLLLFFSFFFNNLYCYYYSLYYYYSFPIVLLFSCYSSHMVLFFSFDEVIKLLKINL